MATTRIVGIALLAVGVIVLILSLVADLVGLGSSRVFGYRQIIGAVGGAAAAIAGLILLLRKRS